MIARHPTLREYDFHRCMQFSRLKAVRGARAALRRLPAGLGQVDAAVCWVSAQRASLGRPAAIGVMSGRLPTLGCASTNLFRWSRPRTVDLLVPAEAEFVLEGTVFCDRATPKALL
jgi:hypothetical protein